MELLTFYNQNGQVVYGTTVNGKAFFFFNGFKSAEEAKETILSQYTGIEKMWMRTFFKGEWSKIQ